MQVRNPVHGRNHYVIVARMNSAGHNSVPTVKGSSQTAKMRESHTSRNVRGSRRRSQKARNRLNRPETSISASQRNRIRPRTTRKRLKRPETNISVLQRLSVGSQTAKKRLNRPRNTIGLQTYRNILNSQRNAIGPQTVRNRNANRSQMTRNRPNRPRNAVGSQTTRNRLNRPRNGIGSKTARNRLNHPETSILVSHEHGGPLTVYANTNSGQPGGRNTQIRVRVHSLNSGRKGNNKRMSSRAGANQAALSDRHLSPDSLRAHRNSHHSFLDIPPAVPEPREYFRNSERQRSFRNRPGVSRNSPPTENKQQYRTGSKVLGAMHKPNHQDLSRNRASAHVKRRISNGHRSKQPRDRATHNGKRNHAIKSRIGSERRPQTLKRSRDSSHGRRNSELSRTGRKSNKVPSKAFEYIPERSKSAATSGINHPHEPAATSGINHPLEFAAPYGINHPHEAAATYGMNSHPHEPAAPSGMNRHPHESTAPSGMNRHPHESTAPSGMNRHPHESTAPSGMNRHPHESTAPSGINRHPHEPATPSGMNRHPHESTAPSGLNRHPHEPAAPSGINRHPHESAAPSGINRHQHEPATPFGINRHPHEPAAPSGINRRPHESVAPSGINRHPHESTAPSGTNHLHESAATSGINHPHQSAATSGINHPHESPNIIKSGGHISKVPNKAVVSIQSHPKLEAPGVHNPHELANTNIMKGGGNVRINGEALKQIISEQLKKIADQLNATKAYKTIDHNMLKTKIQSPMNAANQDHRTIKQNAVPNVDQSLKAQKHLQEKRGTALQKQNTKLHMDAGMNVKKYHTPLGRKKTKQTKQNKNTPKTRTNLPVSTHKPRSDARVATSNSIAQKLSDYFFHIPGQNPIKLRVPHGTKVSRMLNNSGLPKLTLDTQPYSDLTPRSTGSTHKQGHKFKDHRRKLRVPSKAAARVTTEEPPEIEPP